MAHDSHHLWLSLQQLSLDDPSHAVPFTERLRREHDWSVAYTARVLDEYRRFLLLVATHDELTVPSDAVDQVWHQHMLDTRAYWDDLCGQHTSAVRSTTRPRAAVLPIVHDTFSAYESTLRRYREAFGVAPPADIWPSSRERFAGRFRRVDVRHAWLVPKRWLSTFAVSGGAALVLAGCSKLSLGAVAAVSALFVLLGVVFAIGVSQHRRERDAKSTTGGNGCGTAGGCGCPGGGGGGDGGGGCGGGCGD